MPRKDHHFVPGAPDKAVGYLCLPAQGRSRAQSWLYSRSIDLGIALKAIHSDPCPPETSLDSRPGFGAALGALWEEGAGTLLVGDLGSLSPDPCHQAAAVAIVESFGARLISAAPGEAASLEALRPMVDAFWVFRALDHRVRIQVGIAATKRRRRLISRVPPYGWSTAGDGKTLVLNEVEQEVIRLAHQYRSEGLVLREIGERLVELGHHPRMGGAWRPQGIAYLLNKKPEEPLATDPSTQQHDVSEADTGSARNTCRPGG